MRALVRMLIAEASFRRGSFILSVVAVAIAVLAATVVDLTQEAAQRETRRVTRDIGFNLRIIPEEADLESIWLEGFSEHTFPEESIERLAAAKQISYNHLIALLQQKIEIGGTTAVLTGISDEIHAVGSKKNPMAPVISRGTVHVGHHLATTLRISGGDRIEILGESLEVARAMPESGTIDDIRIIGTLADVQRLLAMEGEINEIKAIDCLCLTAAENPAAQLREEIARTLPGAQVVLLSEMADARAKQRRMAERYARFLLPLVLMVSALWVGILAALTYVESRFEIGILRALGHESSMVGALFLGRALLIGLLGAAVGFPIGNIIAIEVAPTIFTVTASAVKLEPGLFLLALAAAPLFAMASSIIPTMQAVAQDPAEILRQE
ncbi:MAG TPA: FtsX-like permease family protein [Planctomycetes bacterium]|nr:FtsX-like permease family protein [Planctomycetota bacterium]